MKKVFSQILFLLLISDVVGQTDLHDISSYYSCILKAEDYVVGSHNDSAILYYKKAFIINKYPFRNDLFNAISVCKIMGDSMQFNEFNNLFSKLDRYRLEETISYNIYNPDTILEIHFLNESEIEQMLIFDQNIRDSCFKISSNAYSIPELFNQIKRVDFDNEKKLQLLLNQYFMSHCHLSYKAHFAVEMIILHLTAWNHYVGLSVLCELMLKGDFYNRTFCGLIDRIGDNNNSKDTLQYPLNINFRTKLNSFSNNTLFINYLDYEMRRKSDSLRVEFFLDDVVSASKKQVFQIENKDFIFHTIHRFFLSEDEYSSKIKRFDNDISGKLKYVIFK